MGTDDKGRVFSCAKAVSVIDQERFHAIDRVVMRHCFDIHNLLGRLCKEHIYQNELIHRLHASGLEAEGEVCLTVRHGRFRKHYYLDVLVEGSVVVELKTAECLSPAHEAQVINYLHITGLRFGKLVNFSGRSVESRFVSTSLTRDDRYDLRFDWSGWEEKDEVSRRVRMAAVDLWEGVGGFLDTCLYRDALLALVDDLQLRDIDIVLGGRALGTQGACLIAKDTSLHVASINGNLAEYESHLRRMLSHTRLRRTQWINIDHRTITFRTLSQ